MSLSEISCQEKTDGLSVVVPASHSHLIPISEVSPPYVFIQSLCIPTIQLGVLKIWLTPNLGKIMTTFT